MDSLVSTAWLADQLGADDLVVLDCSVEVVFDDDGEFHNESGRRAYDAGHIPTAGFADLLDDLCDADAGIDFAVPTPERFCVAMGRLGVGDDTRVVLYDTGASMWAARVWWMLRWVGFDRAALLNGGLAAWTAEDRELSAEPAATPPRTLTPHVRPELVATIDEVRQAIGDEGIRLIDTLPAPMYLGEQPMYAGRSGHIPTSVNLCAMDLFDETGHWRPDAELAEIHDSDPTARTITYCGGGIMASSTAFALARLGFTDVAVYTASMQEWAADPDNPLVVGPD